MRYTATNRQYQHPRFHNSRARNSQPYAVQLRGRLEELRAALNEADETMRPSLTQRIAAMTARFPELNKEVTPCTPQP